MKRAVFYLSLGAWTDLFQLSILVHIEARSLVNSMVIIFLLGYYSLCFLFKKL